MADDHISQDCLLLWLMDAPELCLRDLVAIESRLGGWCKLATKTGEQGNYVRVPWGGRGGHDLVKVHQLASGLPVNVVKEIRMRCSGSWAIQMHRTG